MRIAGDAGIDCTTVVRPKIDPAFTTTVSPLLPFAPFSRRLRSILPCLGQ